MPKILRAVVVTNEGVPEWEGVVIAVERHPWHATPEESIGCTNPSCQKFHRTATADEFVYDFDTRTIRPADAEEPRDDPGWKPMPPEALVKYHADFGIFYAS